MTIVIARKFGERIIIASDTMISHKDRGTNAIPGRLKVIPLCPSLSVAYAGLSDQALTVIRDTHRLVLEGAELSVILTRLGEASREYEIDFIVASHAPNAELRRIWDGNISKPITDAAIGDPSLVKEVLDREPYMQSSGGSFVSREEQRFSSAFSGLFSDNGVHVKEGVGGISIVLHAIKTGHHYQNMSSVARWDRILLGQPETPEQHANLINGTNQWKMSVMGPAIRGVAVAGLLIPDAQVCFIYSPLKSDEAERIRLPVLSTLTETEKFNFFDKTVEEWASQIPGGAMAPEVIRREHITSDEYQSVVKYAELSKYETTITTHDEGLWVSCRGPEGAMECLLSFGYLDEDFLTHASGFIDDLNERVSNFGTLQSEIKFPPHVALP